MILTLGHQNQTVACSLKVQELTVGLEQICKAGYIEIKPQRFHVVEWMF